jgi:transmembrane 9 superfamily protein 2/4
VNKLTSIKNEYPIEYYHLPFCKPANGIQMDHENLGELLSGDRIENSPYRINMKEDMYCEQLCYFNLKNPKKLEKAIKDGYHNNWIVDNLPSASKFTESDSVSVTKYSRGFPIGFIDDSTEKAYIMNHVNIELEYHEVPRGAISSSDEKEYRIVRFTVEPVSINYEFKPIISDDDDDDEMGSNSSTENGKLRLVEFNGPSGPSPQCDHKIKSELHTNGKTNKPQLAKGNILFTYDVIWKENKDVSWASRWDIYLSMNVPDQIHWFSITNSLVILLTLSAVVAYIVIKNVRSDFDRYSMVFDEEADEGVEDSGWKLVHADVFRAPTYPLVMAVFCGTGIQLLCMSFLTLTFAVMGFLNPSRRGSLIMALLILYVFMGSVAGYTSARFYKSFNGKQYQKATFATAFGFPTVFFSIFFLMNLLAVAKRSGDAVPFLRMIELLVLWFGVSTPLVFLGSFFGYKVNAFEYPVSVSSIPRQVPNQPWYKKVLATMIFGGILPFGSCFLQLFFILSSIWMDQYYYIFSFLFLTVTILLVTVAQIAILLNYVQLSSESYHWWWRSFLNGGAVAFFVFGYAIQYFKELHSNNLATYILYFGYMGVMSFALFLVTGSVGLMSCLWFNCKIFGAIKID